MKVTLDAAGESRTEDGLDCGGEDIPGDVMAAGGNIHARGLEVDERAEPSLLANQDPRFRFL